MRSDIDKMYKLLIDRQFIDNDLKMMLTRKRPYILAKIAICYCLSQIYPKDPNGDKSFEWIGNEIAQYFGRKKPLHRTTILHTVNCGSVALLAPYGANKQIAQMIDAISGIKPIGHNLKMVSRPLQSPVPCA